MPSPETWTHEEILERGNAQKDKDRSQCFLEIFGDAREAYEELA